MIVTPSLAWALSAAFDLTGGYALLRWAATMAGPLPRGQRAAELAHLLMSVSMLVMTWAWFGSVGVTVQVVLFTLFTAYFVARAVGARRGVTHACAGGTAHALMAAAMVWMLVSMPLVMAAPVAGSGSGGGHAGHAGHEGHGSGGMDMPTGPPAGWAVGVTLAVAVALVVACGYWAMRALRAERSTAPAEVATTAAADRGGIATLERPAAVAVAPLSPFGTRSDAGCHAVMSLGMAVMLVAMVAGW